jgi:hypothetical protein
VERMIIGVVTFISAIVCLIFNGGVAIILVCEKLIANRAFAALYINMVACECVNLLWFAFWAAPVIFLCVLYFHKFHLFEIVVMLKKSDSVGWDVRLVICHLWVGR